MTTTDLAAAPQPADLAQLAPAAAAYARDARAPATRRAYKLDWDAWAGWAARHGLDALPGRPEALAAYLAGMAQSGRKASSIARALSSISVAHAAAGHPSPRSAPEVAAVLAGIRRTHGTAPARKAPMTADLLRRALRAMPATTLGLRDRALLLLGFAGALRRSELTALDVADVAFVDDGVELTVRRSKTDQAGAGRVVCVPYGRKASCPVRHLRAWLQAAGVAEGPLFRPVSRGGRVGAGRLGSRSVALVVKRAADAVGLDPAAFSGHSLRAGLATSAAAAGKSLDSIMRQTGHASVEVARGYIRHGTRWDDVAAEGLL